ncbi:MAG: LacI family DNA-binding transcriptional regulator [Desulfobacterales bacterium]|nr:LacI family DNA-binding transcriptional regulator [Desulfobacterales bacterium]
MQAFRSENSSPRATGSVTLGDVAKLAGVSPITVSRALNQPEKVAPKTLAKVQKAIALTGYVPNLLAGGLASRRSRLIAAIVPSIANSVYAETIKFFSEKMREANYQVLLGESGYSEEQEGSLIATILRSRPEGVFLTGTNHSPQAKRLLLAANIPVVETWDITPTPLDVVVGFSHQRVGRAVAVYLLSRNKGRIGILSATDHRAQLRQQAFLKTLEEKGVTGVAISTVPVPTSFLAGRVGIASLLDGGFIDGAVFCSSDTLAQGALTEIQSRGLTIPDQIAMVGFGDQPFAAHTVPSLTTVKFDRALMGHKAAEALLSRLKSEPVLQRTIDVGFQLIERQTT